MKVTFESDGEFDDTIKWLSNASRNMPMNTLKKIADKGVEALSRNTPVGDTGETARSWSSEVVSNGNTAEINFKNTAHPESPVSVARLIEVGHATGNGGYVAPRPYIRQALDPVFKDAADQIVKEVTE